MSSELTYFDAARAALEQASTIDEVKRIRDQAEAMRAYMRQADESLGMQNLCAEIKLRAERRLGQMLEDNLVHQGGRPSEKRSHDGTVSRSTLEELGLNKNQSSRWQRLAQIPEEAFVGYIAETQERAEEPTTAGLMRATTRQNTVDVMGSSLTYEWYTPSRFIEAARKVMGGIDFDPASCEQANERIKARRILTFADDGLSRTWSGRVWLNPPYGLSEQGQSNQALWSAAMAKKFQEGEISQGVLLVNSATDASWFWPLWDFPLCFVWQRIQFEGPNGKGPQPTHGNVLAYFGKRVMSFARVFGEFGRVVLPHGEQNIALNSTNKLNS